MRARGVRIGAPAVRLAVQGQEDGPVYDALPFGLRVLPHLWRFLQSTPLLSPSLSFTPKDHGMHDKGYLLDQPDT